MEGSGSMRGGDDDDIEQQIVLSLAVMGAVLISLSLCVMKCAAHPIESEEVYMYDHQRGAVSAIMGNKYDRYVTVREALEKQFEVAIPVENAMDNLDDEEKERIARMDCFFQSKVTDTWLIQRLSGTGFPIGVQDPRPFVLDASCCVGWKSLGCRSVHVSPDQEAEYLEIR